MFILFLSACACACACACVRGGGNSDTAPDLIGLTDYAIDENT
jgi:hypothetical protein